VRIQIDGVNTTEGTGSAGFYYDYGSFDELQIGSDGNDAQAATPGVQLNAVIKSGGNQLKGTIYTDYQNEHLQGSNIDARLAALGVGQGTRTLDYFDVNGDVGGPIQRDKLWYYASLRRQDSTVTVSGFPIENPGDFGQLTSLQNATYKLSYQLSPNNRISHYIQYGRKLLPERGGSSTRYRWTVAKQDSGSWAGNMEWNSILGPRFFFRTALSSFGYNFPQVPYGPNGEDGNLDTRMTELGFGSTITKGSEDYTRTDRRRWQFNWDGQMFQDNWMGGNHTIKVGLLSERESNEDTQGGFLAATRLMFNSSSAGPHFATPYRVQIDNTPRVQINANWHHGAYINDSIQVAQRLTVSLGLRWDYYSSLFPDQAILESPWRSFFYAGAPIAPRFGLSWDIAGNGKTVVKANWGRFHFNTGNASGTVNPLASASATFDWLDVNGDKQFQTNEFGQNRAVSGVGGVSALIDPNLENPYTDSMSVWFERELRPNLGLRGGYTFRMDRNNSEAVELNRVYRLYTLARTFADPGVDGIAGNTDDGPSFTWWDIPGAAPVSLTELRTVAEELADDAAVDFTLTKRVSDRWSLVTSYYYNWDRDARYVQNPNQERFADETITNWNFKIFGTYQAPWGVVATGSIRHQSGNAISRDVNAQGQPRASVPNFLRPSAIVPPRIFRFGARFSF
jgi:hypothetical protein